MVQIQTRTETLLNAVGVTTTSRGIGVDNASNVSVQIFAANITSGSAIFTFQVSNDGTNWVNYSRMNSNLTNTNAQMDTRIAQVLINTNAGSMLFVPAGDTFGHLRVVVTPNNTVDGVYSAIAYVN